MSQKVQKRGRGSAAKPDVSLPLIKENYILFGIGLLFIVIGYIALAQPPWNSFVSLTLAPILLILGYCVIIPVAILYRKKNKTKDAETPS